MIQAIIGLVLAGVLSVGLWSGWTHFTDSYRAEGAAAQKIEDQKVVNAVEARALRAEKSAADAAAASLRQTEAITEQSQRALAAQAETRAISASYAKLVKVSEARISALQAIASAAPRDGRSCEDLLSESDRILRESARVRGVIQ